MKSRFKKSNSWSQLYPHFFPYLSFSIFRITHNSTHFRFDNRYRCGFNSGTFPLKEKTRAIQRGTSPHYWASEKLFLFVFNESKSMSRVVDKSEELNKRSILPYRIQFHASLLIGILYTLEPLGLGAIDWRGTASVKSVTKGEGRKARGEEVYKTSSKATP